MLIPIDYEQNYEKLLKKASVNHQYNRQTFGTEVFEVHINLAKTTVWELFEKIIMSTVTMFKTALYIS